MFVLSDCARNPQIPQIKRRYFPPTVRKLADSNRAIAFSTRFTNSNKVRSQTMSKRALSIVVVFVAAIVLPASRVLSGNTPTTTAPKYVPKYADLHCQSKDDCADGQVCGVPGSGLGPSWCYYPLGGAGAMSIEKLTEHMRAHPGPFKTECWSDADCDAPLRCYGVEGLRRSSEGLGGCLYLPQLSA